MAELALTIIVGFVAVVGLLAAYANSQKRKQQKSS